MTKAEPVNQLAYDGQLEVVAAHRHHDAAVDRRGVYQGSVDEMAHVLEYWVAADVSCAVQARIAAVAKRDGIRTVDALITHQTYRFSAVASSTGDSISIVRPRSIDGLSTMFASPAAHANRPGVSPQDSP